MKKLKILLPVLAMVAVGVFGVAGSEARVVEADSVETSGTYQLVTSTDQLTAGVNLLIGASSQKKVAGGISSQVMSSVDATFSEDKSTISGWPSNSSPVVLTLGGSTDAWTFANKDGKKLGATAVKKLAWGNGTTTWKIDISTKGEATIQNNTSTYGRFLYNVSSPRFTTYTSDTTATMLLPELYVWVETVKEDLDTPTNFSYNNETYNVTWDAVTNAAGYNVVITNENQEEVVNETTTSNSYNVGSLYDGKYTVSVIALGDTNHNDSEAATYPFTKVAPATDTLAALKTKSSLAVGWNKTGVESQSYTLTPSGSSAGSTTYGTSDQDVTAYFEGSDGFTIGAEAKGKSVWVGSDIRLYPNSKNGTKFTFTKNEGKISTVKLTFTNNYSSANCELFIDGSDVGKLTVENNIAEFEVNASSFAIQNVHDATKDNQLRITKIEISAGGASYEVTNAVVRFGAFVNKANVWDKLTNVTGYGVALATSETVDKLAGDSLTEVLEVYADEKDTLLDNNVGFAEGDVNNLTIDEEGNVFFNARLEVPTEKYSTVVCAVAYVVVDGEYVFLQETSTSVVAEANYYLEQHENGNNVLDSEVVNALSTLVA